ncbi:Bug family tripartite tricarboxylate transporter substrate binding protein [Pseudorhodoplanes sinuspersici]|uniref:Uncharacterized protein n=1 Tax=Pseudorhodoplanes sinuspersici TaxID=1235591 RepID=A0A1W6ZK40_9HYPH|nr:tripartite tricarboxylate transporter substrate-binding protein [Pseudorhodoplanes sinuspersici]ARP97783.1 hypothetical protein CAK95_00825 [Pseudorhodoplanes sinuspersici]RKE68490.1 tripartite-type tricarboxylate transporter receptor subunit TctC [Pseudorhodoplanes sinuspersici]
MKLASTLAIAGLIGTCVSAYAADCTDFPKRPIEIVVPYGAGGGVDIASRTLAAAAKAVKGWDMRVSNRTGAGTVTGQNYLASQAPADGYTIGVMPLIAAVLNDADPRNGIKAGSLEVLEAIAFDPWLFVAMKGQTVDSLVAKAKSGGGTLRYAVSPGSEQGMLGQMFANKHGIKLTNVPLAGGVQRLGGLLNGSVDLAPSFYGEAKQYLDSKMMVPIGFANDIPYWADESIPALGTKGYEFGRNFWGSYRVILTPSGVPENIKACLADSLTDILNSGQGKELFLQKTIKVEPIGYKAAKSKYAEFQAAVTKLLSAQKSQ